MNLLFVLFYRCYFYIDCVCVDFVNMVKCVMNKNDYGIGVWKNVCKLLNDIKCNFDFLGYNKVKYSYFKRIVIYYSDLCSEFLKWIELVDV